MSWPGTGDPYYTAEGNTRRNFYAINSVPRLEVDGQWDGNSNSYTAALRDAAYNVPSFMEITSDYEVECNTVNLDVTVKALQSFSGTNVLHVAIFEHLTYNNVKSNGETEFLNVMKKMLPDAGGTNLGAINNGDSLTFSFTHTFPGNYRLPANANSPINNSTEHSVEEFFDLGIVAWVQNTGTRDVHQSAYSTDLITRDGAMIEMKTPSTLYMNAAPFNLKPVFQNWQDNAITSFDLNYTIDNGPVQTTTISGVSLGLGDTIQPSSSIGWTPATTGTYTIKMWASNINGGMDEVACNDTITQVIDVFPPVQAPVAAFTYGGSGLSVNFQNTSTEDPNVTHSYFWSFGDGSPFQFLENPSYTYASAGTYLACLTVSNAAGSNIKCENVVVPLVGIQDEILENVAVFPNPSNGVFEFKNDLGEEILVIINDPAGKEVASFGVSSLSEGKVDLGEFSSGIYFARIKSSKGEAVKKLNLK